MTLCVCVLYHRLLFRSAEHTFELCNIIIIVHFLYSIRLVVSDVCISRVFLNQTSHLRILPFPPAAGLYGLKGHGPGSIHRLAHLSYAGREFLAERLNGTPQDRNTFNNFCLALGVDQRLVQVSMRSRNPTGYLIQEFSEKPEATFDRLERALSEIGHHELFHQLQAVDSRPMYGGDDV